MLYDAGLILSVAIGAWLALDVAMAEVWRRRSLSIGLLGGFGALWAASELLLRVADLPGEFAFGRRMLYLGVIGTTFSWYRTAVEADSPEWWRRNRRFAALPLLPLVLVYSCLFWAPDGWVISLYSKTPGHGPLYFVAMLVSWVLISGGLFHYTRAALRLRQISRLRTGSLAVGILVPFGCNVLYAMGFVAIDYSPALLGFAAVMIRFAVIDTGLGLYLPLARSDIIEQLTVGVVVIDVHDRVVDANAAAGGLLGCSTELIGRRFAELTDELAEGIEVYRFPLRSHVAIPGSGAVITDRTAAIRAEQRLQLAARLEALGSLTAGIAHEVNNPLAYVQSNLNLVERLLGRLSEPGTLAKLPQPLRPAVEDGVDGLADARDGIERISMLVTRLRGFAREPHDDGADAELDAVEVVGKAVAVASVGLPSHAVSVRAEEIAPIVGNEPALVQILVNLILNAIQASANEPADHHRTARCPGRAVDRRSGSRHGSRGGLGRSRLRPLLHDEALG